MLWLTLKVFQKYHFICKEDLNYDIGMKRCFFCGFILLFMFHVCLVSLFVHCSLFVICWERADLLVLLCVMFYCAFVTFRCGVFGQLWCLIVSIPHLCLLSYFNVILLCFIQFYDLPFIFLGMAMFVFAYFALTRMVNASELLHNRMLKSILHAPMLFFDTTPIGRIVNRFSSDVDVMDDRLLQNFRLWTVQVFSLLATIVVVCINTPYFITVLVPVMGVYLFLLVRIYRFEFSSDSNAFIQWTRKKL